MAIVFQSNKLQGYLISMHSAVRTAFKPSNYGQLDFAFIGKVFSVVIV